MIRYLTGCSNPGVLAVAHDEQIGLMLNPASGYRSQVERWPYFAIENGCFARGDAFDLTAWLATLASLSAERTRCLFAVAPDVRCDAQATLVRSRPVLAEIHARGFPAAFVAQNGLTVETTPWEEFEVLFIGGDDAFKVAEETQRLITTAKALGRRVHGGRCNSLRRLQAMALQGCDTADGTYLGFGPDVNLARLLGWLRTIREQPHLELWRQNSG